MTGKRRATAKAPKEQGAKDTGKVRLNVRIDAAEYERLMIHCLKAGQGPGEMVGGLINTHLREWRVQANPTASVNPTDRLAADGPVSSPAHLAL